MRRQERGSGNQVVTRGLIQITDIIRKQGSNWYHDAYGLKACSGDLFQVWSEELAWLASRVVIEQSSPKHWYVFLKCTSEFVPIGLFELKIF